MSLVMDWYALAIGVLCASSYLFGLRRGAARVTDEHHRRRLLRAGWIGAGGIVAFIVVVALVPWRFQPWILVALLLALATWIARGLVRGTIRGAGLGYMAVLFVALGLMVGGGFATGWAATTLVGAGFVTLVVGGRIIQRRVGRRQA
jgi:hypothetical protein